MPNAPSLFVSHSHRDDAFGQQLVADLRRHLGEDAVWYDAAGGLHAGDEWWQRIVAEISAREVFLVVLSPDALASNWVQREMAIAFRLHVERQKQLLPVLYRPCERRADWALIQDVSFVAPRPYAKALTELLTTLGVQSTPQPTNTPPPVPPPVVPSDAPSGAAPTAPRPVGAGRLSRRAVLASTAGLAGTATVTGILWWTASHLGPFGQSSTHTPTPTATTSPTVTPTPTAVARPDLVPARLATLGFVGQQVGNITIVIPPVSDIPAGAFTMGDGSDYPTSQVTVSAFQIGTFAVTAAEYVQAVAAGVVAPPPTTYFSDITWQSQQANPDYPVVNVTWLDVLAYVRWLSAVTKQPWRLVEEAEWEKAARGTDGRAYPWGNTFDPARVDYYSRSPVGTHPSGASPYGVMDMAHKVFEWCSSLDQPYPYSATDGRESLTDTTSNRILRSCSWDRPDFAGATYARSSQPLDTASATNGFRLARSLS
jgi:hypothetical protein